MPKRSFIIRALIVLFLVVTASSIHAQRRPVNRNNGKPIPCIEQECDDSDSTYESVDINCLSCFLATSDSTMKSEIENVLQVYKNKNRSEKSFLKEQQTWSYKTKQKATKAGAKYEGGTVESSEFARIKLIETNKRITYLRKLKTSV